MAGNSRLEASAFTEPVPELAPRPEAGAAEAVPRYAFRLNDVCTSLGMGRRTLEKLRAAGKFPKPDRHIGKCPVWHPSTVERWVKEGGGA
jgi:predicted DNA-binding transcriptional regulator AlpA